MKIQPLDWNDARLSALFVDANAFDAPEQWLHYKFLTTSFPEFALLTYEEYLDLILPVDREWYAGNVTEFIAVGAEPVFGFTVWDSGVDPAATITCAQLREVHEVVKARIPFGAVAAVPSSDLQREVLATCDVPITAEVLLDTEWKIAADGRLIIKQVRPFIE